MKQLIATPTPKLVTVPSGCFFVRTVPVTQGEGMPTVGEQVEMALEALAPFPLTQVYFGYCWRQGWSEAVAYAAYRRRFTEEQWSEGTQSEWVGPEFAPYLGLEAERAETLLLASADAITAIHWGRAGEGPSAVVVRAWDSTGSEEKKAATRAELVREMGETVTLTELEGPAEVVEVSAQGVWGFKSGERQWTLKRAEMEAMDVREALHLEGLRRMRGQDVLLWRAFLAGVGLVVLGLLVQGGLAGAMVWEKTRQARIDRRAPEVAAINRANELAARIDELATRRLMPFEMIDLVKAKKPKTLVFKSTTTQGAATLEVTGTTTVAADLPAYRAALVSDPGIEKVEVTQQNAQNGVSTVQLLITFKPEALKKEASQ